MAYAPEFYVPENIIGYTGVLNKNPTVYFLSASHYGHITQVHDEWRNVGRETIRSNARYAFGNVGTNNSLVEVDPAAPMSHVSRSPMILVGSAIPPELTHAIMVHSEQKALRLGAQPVITDENLARGFHPGQQPTKSERKAAQGGGTLFRWQQGQADGVPADSRLAAFSK